ncbi:MAG: ABC transporter permease [Chloroflexota bacterium]
MFRTLIRKLPIGWAADLALQRLVSQWRSLLTIIAGVLLSAAVGALVPLYTTAVAQVGMVERFNQLPPEQVNANANLSLIAAQTPNFTDSISSYDKQFRDITDRQLGQKLPGWVDQVVFFGETSALAIDPPALPAEAGTDPVIPDPTTRAFVAYYDGWQQAVNLVAGRLPTDNSTPDVDIEADIEIVVPFEAQRTLGISVNDILLLDQGGPKGGWPTSKNIRARVVGISSLPEPLSPLQRAYFMAPSPLRLTASNGNFKAEYPVLTTRASFERVALSFVPDTPTRIGWRVLFDHRRLPFAVSPKARQALFDFQGELVSVFSRRLQADLQYNYSTGLIHWQSQGGTNSDTGAMLAYEQSVRSLDAPFGLLLLQVGALVIFFLLVTAALVRRSERREIAMLQSRGATNRQIVAIRGIEALIICTLAALLAPVLAQQLLIAVTPFFANYSGLPLTLTPAVFLYAALAASVAFIVLMLTLRPVLNLPLITSGGTTTRSDRQPWWERYYLDVILVIVGIAALWRLAGRNTPLFTTTAGGRTTDPFLLLAPALLFLGLGSILLRLFPVIAAAGARFLSAGRGLMGTLATWQLSREPIHYGRITFLLALAIGIGWFATSFRATVSRSQSDQAQYKIGTDLRFNERDLRLNAAHARPESSYEQIPGVTAATLTWRQPNVNFQSDPNKPAIFTELLALDSDKFGQMYYWRSDLGTVKTPRPPGQPIALPERGAVLPLVPQKINLWADFTVRGAFAVRRPDLDRLRQRTTIFARLLDGAGTWLRVPFKVTEVEYASTGQQSPGLTGGGAFSTDGWAYLEADLSTLAYQPVGPVRLVSLYWQHSGRVQTGERDLELTLAGLTASDSSGKAQPLDLFNRTDWQFDYDSGATSVGTINTGFADARHGQGITAQWDQNAELATVGALLNYPTIPSVPVVVSNSLAAQLRLQAGQTVNVLSLEQQPVTFTVVSGQQYYPTLYDAILQDRRWISDDKNHPFAITDRDALLYTLNRRPSAALYADEVWLKTAPGVDSNVILQKLRPADSSAALVNVQTLNSELSNLQTDPLSLGLLGLMFLAFVIAMSLSVVGLLTYSTLTAVARRGEFGVLRALGLSTFRLLRQLAFEQLFVIVLGVGLGAILGAVLSNQVVPKLAQNASSQNITPPFIIQVETAALLQYGVVIFVVLALVLLSALLVVRQLSISRSLRIGEE